MRDDGIGFDCDDAAGSETHVGLRIMAERAEKIGATLDVISTPGRGTAIVLTLLPPSPAQYADSRQPVVASGAATPSVLAR